MFFYIFMRLKPEDLYFLPSYLRSDCVIDQSYCILTSRIAWCYVTVFSQTKMI